MSGLGLFVRKIVRSNIENEYQNKKHQYFYAWVPTLRLPDLWYMPYLI